MTIPWHHSPAHRFIPGMIYIVTAGTLNKNHHFKGPDRLEFLQEALLRTLEKHQWKPHVWSVFVNHYHFIARPSEKQAPLSALIKELHSITAREVNRLDRTCGRQVWFQYWDNMPDA